MGPRFLSKERSRDETGHRYPIPWLKSSRQHQTGFTRCKTTRSRRGVCAPASAPTSRQFQLQVNLARQLFHSPRRSCRTTAPDNGAHPFRSAHVHFTISASGHRMLLGIRFRPVRRYLESDTVFGVKPSLIVPPEKRVVLDRLPLRP